MADIFVDVDSIVNNSILDDIELLTLDMQPDSFVNSTSVDDVELSLDVQPNTFVNSSSVGNVQVDFVILPNTFTNTSTITPFAAFDYLTVALTPDSFINSSTVPSLTIDNPISLFPSTIINESIVSNIDELGNNRTFVFDTIPNNNIVPPIVISFENIPIVGEYKQRPTPIRDRTRTFVFADFAMDFLPHPMTGDIAVLYDADAINQSLHNIVHTQRFERPFEMYDVASRVRSLLFELSDNLMHNELKSELFTTIVNNEPRILVVDIVVDNVPSQNAISISIFYKIKTFDQIEKFQTIITRT